MKTAFVLTGEGARGAFQAGVMLALEKKGIKPDALYGISSGSINAAAYSYLGALKTYFLWTDITEMSDILKFNWFSFWRSSGLFNLKPAEKIAKKIVKNAIGPKATVARCNALLGKIEYLNNHDTNREEFLEATLDSMRIAGLVEAREGTYFDAGALELNPLGRAIRDGYKDIHVIFARRRDINHISKRKGAFPFIDYAFRSLDLTMHQMMVDDLNLYQDFDRNLSIKIYEPETYLYNQLDFKKCHVMANIGLTNYRVTRLEQSSGEPSIDNLDVT